VPAVPLGQRPVVIVESLGFPGRIPDLVGELVGQAQAAVVDLGPSIRDVDCSRGSPLSGDDGNPVEQPACEVGPGDRTTLVAGEEAALPLQAAAGDDVLVRVAGQQAETVRRKIGRTS
jgi:hypothetical protein